jgi:vacuolar-type H+-ATPase subunit H
MSVYRVLDKLEACVHEGTWLPAGYRILSEERLIELLEKIRASLPEEVGRAKVIAKDHDRMMRAAQEKAQAIVDEAASKHEELVEDSEILRRARTTADVVLREAEEKARKVRDGADRYANDVLAEMEGRLFGALGAVRKGRQVLDGQRQSAERPLEEAAAKSKRAAFDLQTAAEETAALESV